MCSLVMSPYPHDFIVISLLLIKSLYHYTSCSVVFIVITHTSAWFLDGEIHQLVVAVINSYSVFKFFKKYSNVLTFYSILV